MNCRLSTAGSTEPARLYVIATPIGNLGDISRRALEVLARVPVLACESPTATRRLYSALGLTCPRLVAYREEGRDRSAQVILQQLQQGMEVGLVSEAGTPGISDPGRDLIARCHDLEIPVSCIPGPSAVICAVALSGLPARRWVFEGFLSPKGSERRQRLQELAREERTAVLLEAPHRVARTLADLLEHLGDRPAFIGRELTKRFEECRQGTLSTLLAGLGEPRGEFVLVVQGAEPRPAGEPQDWSEAAAWLRQQGLGARQTADFLCRFGGVPRRAAYALAAQDRTNF